MEECVVYLYCDPKDGTPRYVGVGTSLRRAWSHMKPYAKTNKRLKNMITKRLREGYSVSPVITYLGHTDFEEAKRLEMLEISRYGRVDLGTGSLFNLTDGGDGAKGAIFSEERRKTIRENTTNQHRDPWISNKMYQSQRATSARDDVKARRSEAQKRAQSNKLTREKQRQSVLASETPERRAMRSNVAKIVQNDPVVKERKSVALKRSAQNPEIAARRAASIRAANTPEVRAKKSATMKATLARKKLLITCAEDMPNKLQLID